MKRVMCELKDGCIEAIIEIPMGSRNKYEICEDSGRIKLDRVLYSSMSYPAEYGYIDYTLALDGDPLDILVLTTEPTFPGCVIQSRVIGYLDAIDDGDKDYKLIAVNDFDPRFNHICELEDIPPHTLAEIKNFFETYKILEKKEVEIKDYHGKDEALQLLKDCRKRYLDQNK